MRTLDEQFPPVIPADVQTVATFIPSRSPSFKVHTKAGLAHNALGYHGGFTNPRAKYELVDGQWQRVWAYLPPDNCRRCGRLYADVLEEQKRQAGRNYHWHHQYHSDPTYTGPKWCEEPVCMICTVEIKQAEKDTERRELHERYFLNK